MPVKDKLLRSSRNTKATGRTQPKKLYLLNTYDWHVGDKISVIKKGISKKQFEDVKLESGLDYDTLSTVLSVSRAKLINKKGTERFDKTTSERIMQLADLISFGQHVFGNKDVFNSWLKTPNKALGDKVPTEIMDTVYGITEVKNLLGKINYGVF